LLYKYLGSLVGLKCLVINGDSKTDLSDIGRKRLGNNHAWNTVLIDGRWILVDVTWAQGYYDSKRLIVVKEFTPLYFDQKPKFFYAKHFPNEWEHFDNVGNVDTFLNSPLIYDSFIKTNCEIITPDSGIIQANDGEKITFKIKNISKFDNLYYLDKNNKIINVENLKEKNGLLEFQIDFNKNLGQYLTFYLYNKSLVTFKIIPRTKLDF
jgi:transglutaminase/protease-like cytokinesis protein 3